MILNQAASHVANIYSAWMLCKIEYVHRQKWGETRKLLAKEKKGFQARSPSFGDQRGVNHSDYLTCADQEIPN